MDGMGWGDIIFFAAIAAFIFLRYRAMLGEQHGRDKDQIKRDLSKRESSKDRVIQLMQKNADEAMPSDIISPMRKPSQNYGEALEACFADMRAMDTDFDIEAFKEGAKGAFEMVIEAFNDADRATLRELLARDIYKNFESVLKQRDAEESHSYTTLVAITEATVTDAVLEGKTARITMQFLSDQIQQMKDQNGNGTDDGTSVIETVEDEWVFERSLASSNPSWLIIQT